MTVARLRKGCKTGMMKRQPLPGTAAVGITNKAGRPVVESNQIRPWSWPDLRIAAVLLGVTIITRGLFCHQGGDDEAFFALVGREWLAGAPPYVGVHDVKPPGLFALASLSETVFGPHVLAIKVIEGLAVWFTAFAVFRIGRRVSGAAAGWMSATFFVVISVGSQGANQPAELIFSAISAVAYASALLCPVDADSRRAKAVVIAAGLAFGLALTVKQTALFEAVGFVVVLGLGLFPNPTLRRPAILGLGLTMMAMAPLGFVAYFMATGHYDALYSDAVVGALRRNQMEGVTWGQAALRFLPSLRPMLPLVVGSALLWTERRRLPREQRRALLILSIWLASAALEAMAGRAMYARYFLPLAPSLSVFSAVFAVTVLGGIHDTARRRLAQAVVVIGVVGFGLAWNFRLIETGWRDYAKLQAAARVLREYGVTTGQPILVLSPDLDLYLESGAAVGTSYTHPVSLLCLTSLQGADTALARVLSTRPPIIVTPNRANHRICDLPEKWVQVSAALSSDYCPVATFRRPLPGIPTYDFTIFARRMGRARTCGAGAM